MLKSIEAALSLSGSSANREEDSGMVNVENKVVY
jgi:hypothetical protein